MRPFETQLTLRENGRGSKIRIDAFSREVELFKTAIVEAGKTVGIGKESLHVSKLELGSAIVSAASEHPKCDLLAAAWSKAVECAGQPASSRDTKAVKALREMKAVAEKLGVGEVQIDDRLLFAQETPREPETGIRTECVSVEGRLDEIDVHARVRFRVYPPGQDRGIQCRIPADTKDEALWLQRIQSALRRRVTVSGKATYRGDVVWPSSIEVTDLVVHSPDSIPKLVSIVGTGFVEEPGDPMKYIRELRDEDG